MILISDIIAKARDAIIADTDLAAWCEAQFSKPLTLFVGMDERDPPGEKDCPFVTLLAGKASDGQEDEDFDYLLQVDWGIKNASFPLADGVKEAAGVAQSALMGKKLRAIIGDMSGNVSIVRIDTTYDHSGFFPMFMGASDMLLRVPNVIGGEVSL